MSEHFDGDSGVTLSTPVFYLLLSAVGLGGAGVFGVTGVQFERDVFEQCVNNSEIAIKVAAQHGEELLELRSQIYSRTQSRYTADNAESDRRKQSRVDEIQDRRIQLIESHIEKEERRDGR